jgi:uncharacterized protein YndB with AHSA1/START domain
MKNKTNNIITVNARINAPVDKVWSFFTGPEHIVRWNNASDDWHTPRAENDLRPGGRFLSRMEARDGSEGFDFSGTYTRVEPLSEISYKLDDDRLVQVSFVAEGTETVVTTTFEAEQTNSTELQQTGWQAILDNFREYSEKAGGNASIHFEITIDAAPERVCKTMLDTRHYASWTEVFNPHSSFEGSWEKGSSIRFLGVDKDGKVHGMVSRIKENVPGRFVSIEHLGIIQDGVEIYSGPIADEFAGSLENYTFTGDNGQTSLSVDMVSMQNTSPEFVSYFEKTWPQALEKLKSICEAD